jgi:hypothetical protein
VKRRWRPAASYDLYFDTFYEFPPVSGLEIANARILTDFSSDPPAHRQGRITAFAYWRRRTA